MRVSESKRVLFVHIEKTGGKTIDTIFDDEIPDGSHGFPRGRHAGYTRILKERPEWSDYWSFGFVRNPWARMVSWWSMAVEMRDKLDAGDPKSLKRYSTNQAGWDPIMQYGRDFEAFVLRGTEEVPRLSRQQIAKLTDRASGKCVDFIGRQERYIADLNIVRERLELEPVAEMPRVNASSHGHYTDYYSDASRRRIAEVYRRDVKVFGYTFGD